MKISREKDLEPEIALDTGMLENLKKKDEMKKAHRKSSRLYEKPWEM